MRGVENVYVCGIPYGVFSRFPTAKDSELTLSWQKKE